MQKSRRCVDLGGLGPVIFGDSPESDSDNDWDALLTGERCTVSNFWPWRTSGGNRHTSIRSEDFLGERCFSLESKYDGGGGGGRGRGVGISAGVETRRRLEELGDETTITQKAEYKKRKVGLEPCGCQARRLEN